MMSKDDLTLVPLTRELIEPTIAMCGECVGKNLYTEEMLLKALERPEEKFLLLVTPENKPVAYLYIRLIGIEEAEQIAKLSLSKLKELTGKDTPLIGNMQSIGVLPEYRNHDLSKYLIELGLQWLTEETEADIAFGVCWKPYGKVPVEKTVKSFGFSHLADSRRVWYDRTDLICPVCKGRCECDAAIYYKRLDRRGV